MIARRRLQPGADRAIRRRRSPRPRGHRGSVFHRYSGDEDFPQHMALQGLLDKEDEKRALILGLAWRFAFSLSASAAGELCALPPAHDPVQGRPGSSHPARSHRRRAGAAAAGRAGRCPGPQGRDTGRLAESQFAGLYARLTPFWAYTCALAPKGLYRGLKNGCRAGLAGRNARRFQWFRRTSWAV